MKKIVVIFAGRQKYMELLLAHLDKQRSAFDELHICQNARTTWDATFINQYAAANPGYVTLIPRTNIQLGYLDFYNQLSRDDVYLKLDDDIVYIGDGAINAMFTARLADTTSLLVSGQIINNMRDGDPNVAHQGFIAAAQAGSIDSFKVADETIPSGLFSINAICFYPRDIPVFTGYQSDEVMLTTILPMQLNKSSALCGGAIFVHYSFANRGVNSSYLKQYRALVGLNKI